jgi:hypothetical protein
MTWDAAYTRKAYYWMLGISYGYSYPDYPSLTPAAGSGLSAWGLAPLAHPAECPLAHDYFLNFHSEASNWRWNVVFADGHAKLSKYVDTGICSTCPYYWDLYNPMNAVDVNRPCQPDCKTQAGGS